jgi:hypothetical protein
MVEMGRCGTCGTPVGLVVGVDRPVKVDEVCPNEVCILGDWVILAPGQARMVDTWADYTACCADM